MSSPTGLAPSDSPAPHFKRPDRSAPLQPPETLSADDRLNSLLLRWQEQQSQGNDLSAAQLCRDYPELEPQLREQIGILRHMKALLGTPEGSGSQTLDLIDPWVAGRPGDDHQATGACNASKEAGGARRTHG